jgi:ABC-type branched-subunit amino acid transport system substrate-binding protein
MIMNKKILSIFVLIVIAVSVMLAMKMLHKPRHSKLIASTSQPLPTTIVENRYEIQLCSTLPLTGELAVLGTQIFDGMSLLFNKVQQDPQLPFLFRLNVRDNQADMALTHANVNIQLKESSSPLFVNLFGTDTISTLLPMIIEKKLCALFPIDGASDHRMAAYTNMVFFRASYEQEIEALVDYTANTLQRKKIAIFYEASDWGEAVLSAFKKVLERYHLPLVAAASYPQQTLNITSAVKQITENSPNAILCIAQARPAYNFIQQIINKGLYKTVILGLSSLISIQETIKESRGVQIITSSVVPDPENSTLQIAQEYRTDLQKYSPNKKPSPYSFEGYINAALLTEFVKSIELPVSIEKLLQAIESLGHVRFKGIELEFNPSTRTLSSNVWINTGYEKEWFLAKKNGKP